MKDCRPEVELKNELSDPLVVFGGVPQGSVLALSLLLSYISDLMDVNFDGDDTFITLLLLLIVNYY